MSKEIKTGGAISTAWEKSASGKVDPDSEVLTDLHLRASDIISSFPLAILMLHLHRDRTLLLAGANPAADDLLTLDHSRLIGEPFEAVFPEWVGTVFFNSLSEVAEQGGVCEGEIVHAAGDAPAATLGFFVFQAYQGTSVALFHNVTERKMEEEMLSRASTEVGLVIEQSTAELAQINHQLRDEIKLRESSEIALRRSMDIIEALHSVALQLERCEDVESACTITIDAAERLLLFPACCTGLMEKSNFILRASSAGFPEEFIDRLLTQDLSETMHLESEETFFINQIPDTESPVLGCKGYRSMICARFGESGLFYALSPEQDFFCETDARLLQLLLGYTGEAVRRIGLQNELKHQAIYDSLTDLFNRNFFNQMIKSEVERAFRYNHSIGVIVVDIDLLKVINDRFGHQTGDRALIAAARFLSHHVRETDTIFRMGGDEFLILLPETGDEVKNIEIHLTESMSECEKLTSLVDFPVTLSIGSTTWKPSDTMSLKEKISEADRNMYSAKKRRARESGKISRS